MPSPSTSLTISLAFIQSSMSLSLKPFHPSEIPDHTELPLPLVKIDDKGELHYAISKILDLKLDWQCKCQLQYLVKWAGYKSMDKEIEWILAEDLDSGKALDNFHSNPTNKDKPGPLPKHQTALIQYMALRLTML
ncbi:hypothetical protein Moror_3526 [Moniliophthora roreri MCA 2997]|uniref:Chromo domain-containing protein n=1 Tax=Moniliophthora roreri (strain MCA 2997) TaxID=1381753 RepID=V2WNG7_MONRO|nr:hypothetical protein Moror_3526 [Moniliophthora roreri MCA 2997]